MGDLEQTGTRMAINRIARDYPSVRHRLDSALRDLAHEIETAREELAEGKPVNEHMIQNAGMNAARYTAQYNLLRDMHEAISCDDPPPDGFILPPPEPYKPPPPLKYTAKKTRRR